MKTKKYNPNPDCEMEINLNIILTRPSHINRRLYFQMRHTSLLMYNSRKSFSNKHMEWHIESEMN